MLRTPMPARGIMEQLVWEEVQPLPV
jgi:hypothetical protein